ncbi:AAA family ATPase [Amantichitinum ursilacus]|uniref:ATPase RavA n=1 Tax=Amantichitinum ursilacus TaxID=857265 RepID=A0A0N0GPH1_9NEIS|nr:AAA family ATPase [Amantichitinum ursilacus]KPC53760.1 ATPase RavA [Amantichitinum ursilacus]
MISELQHAADHLRASMHSATTGLVGREQLAELIVLAAVAQEHLLVVGPPGTAKSAVVRRVAQTLGGNYFEYLLGRFTEPSELFGPVNLQKLREGTVETDVSGMLPEADIAFLDEVFLGSTAILNTLLGILNERRFRRGHTQLHCPLRVCVAAANGLPDDEALAAFGDRFLIHLFVAPVADDQLEAMLAGGWSAAQHVAPTPGGLASLDLLSASVKQVDMSAAMPALVNAIRALRAAGIQLSDRRIVKSQWLIAAAAVLAGRLQAQEADIWPLLYVLPTQPLQNQAREVLRDLIALSHNPTLYSACEQAVQQPLSRTTRLQNAAQACLSPAAASPAQDVEALLREIDANFSIEQLPESLRTLRSGLVERLAAVA